MKANGFQVYTGPSELDGQPIKAVITGTQRPSVNAKTGDMLQLWIMPTSSKPSDAVKNGDDASVCGNCPHRPINGGQCYVRTEHAPNSVYRVQYPSTVDSRPVPLRLGAWGDPAALPYETVAKLVTGKHTGYTHQWKTCDPRFKTLLMASVDSESEAIEAQKLGWRTFRVRKPTESLSSNEIACPASKEAGVRVQCADCGLCAGTSRQAKNIAIIQH
jgi:hypothetical protein